MIACRENIGKIKGLLVGDAIWDLQKVDVALRDANILRLASREPAREMRVSEKAGVAVPVHGIHEGGRVCTVAERRQLLLAVFALPACDLE